MTGRDLNTSLARTLVDEWVRGGVREAVLAPGSRSSPLALALAADDRIRLSVFLDERSAAFFALGAAKASGRPAVVACTSGTAAANFHPAVLEAWHANVPLVVCTADRPPELRDTGAGQTVDQLKLYGGALRWFVEVGVPEDVEGAGRYWRSIAARACVVAGGPPAGPVHLNLPFREPLVPTGVPLIDAPGREGGAPWTLDADAPEPPTELEVPGNSRGIVTAGWNAGVSPETVARYCAATGWPLLADAVSGLRAGVAAISTYDPLLRSPELAEALQPDVVLQLGAPLTNKAARAVVARARHHILVDPQAAWLDPDRTARVRLRTPPAELLAGPVDDAWSKEWATAESTARRAIDDLLDGWDEPFEGRVLRDVARCLPDGSTVVVGSSMPVRDAESFVAPRDGLRWLCNRGANGIDGFVSTVLGAARVAAAGQPVVGLMGDLTLLHDAGGLLHANERGLDAVLVVLDNDGGGIFSFLSQAHDERHFERLFGTPHGRDLTVVLAAYGVPATRVEKAADVVPAVLEAAAAGGVRAAVVPTDRSANVTRHRQVWQAVAAAVRP